MSASQTGRALNMKLTKRKRLFLILWSAAFAGILSLLLIDMRAIFETLPLPPGTELPQMPMWLLKVVSLIQPTVLVTIAVIVGIGLAPKVGLTAPVVEALADGDPLMPVLKTQIVPGIIGGVAAGFIIIPLTALTKPDLPAGAPELIAKFGDRMPLITRFLYGGVTEEVLLRWGLMTLLVWASWRVFQKGRGAPMSRYFIAAIVISALIFGIGHLPIALMLLGEPTLVLILFVIAANSAFGMIAGWLYWKKGLEAAIIAHVTAHIVLFTGSKLGAYF